MLKMLEGREAGYVIQILVGLDADGMPELRKNVYLLPEGSTQLSLPFRIVSKNSFKPKL